MHTQFVQLHCAICMTVHFIHHCVPSCVDYSTNLAHACPKDTMETWVRMIEHSQVLLIVLLALTNWNSGKHSRRHLSFIMYKIV